MLALPTLPDTEIARIRGLKDPGKADPDAGFGALRTERGVLPLVALEVEARLEGLLSSVEVAQVFVNTHDQPLEATYIFPLPDRAAVSRFRLEVAGRVVEGDLEERGKARRQYDQAILAGHRAAIAEEERAGVFAMRVGNLPPGERAVVRLGLVGPLPYADGQVTFRFPLVVAPRYIPGAALPGPAVGAGTAADTAAVPDASRISPPVLLPGFPNPVALRLTVEVADSPPAPHSFRSSLHTVVEEEKGNARLFRLQPGERLDRDFILRYGLGGEGLQSSLAVAPDEKGEQGTFLLTLMPAGPDARPRPRDVVFVLDRSGSMSGWKMVAARRAVARMVETLTEEDRFTVYAFDDAVETPPGFDDLALVPASDRQRFRAAEFLAGLEARGGTEMAEPLRRAMAELGRPGSAGDRLLVLITDGQVGNEDQILRQLGEREAGQRIFTLGIDRAVNAAFLRRLADLGGGASEVVESEARLDEVMDRINRLTGTPLLTDLQLRPAGLDVIADSLVPSRLPDLFAGAPVLIAGRYRGPVAGAVALQAKAGEAAWAAEVEPRQAHRAPLARVWARGRVRELEDRYVVGRGDRAKLEHQIVETSLRFGVLSRFTAFVAVDRSEVVNPGGRQGHLTQAVEQPSGWAGQPDPLAAQAMPPAPAGYAGYSARGPNSPSMLRDGLSDTESVDSYLSVLPEEAPPPVARHRKAKKAAPAPGVVQRMLGAVFGSAGPAARHAPPPLDRGTFRQYAEGLLRRLREGVGADADSRLKALRGVTGDLQTLVQALVAAGDSDVSVKRLEELAARLAALLGQAAPPPVAVAQLYQDIVAALEACLKLVPAAPVQAPREGFWK
jgi:Ca-activated chloride channel family protein